MTYVARHASIVLFSPVRLISLISLFLLYEELSQTKSTKNGIVALAAVTNLREEPVRSKKTCWTLSQQCDRPDTARSVPEAVRQKTVYRNKGTPRREAVLSGPLTTLTFTSDK